MLGVANTALTAEQALGKADEVMQYAIDVRDAWKKLGANFGADKEKTHEVIDMIHKCYDFVDIMVNLDESQTERRKAMNDLLDELTEMCNEVAPSTILDDFAGWLDQQWVPKPEAESKAVTNGDAVQDRLHGPLGFKDIVTLCKVQPRLWIRGRSEGGLRISCLTALCSVTFYRSSLLLLCYIIRDSRCFISSLS